jgi:hypothetical protein
MAKVLSKTGVQTGQTIQAFHISQSVDAFTGLSAYNITISGGLTVNGYSFPTADGIADQVMATDGSGNLTFQTLPLAATASFITSSGVKGPYGGDSITTASYAVSASHVEFADLASASYHAVNASDANTATTASHAVSARSASFATTSSYSLDSTTASLAITASYITSSNIDGTVANADTATSSSYATTASFAVTSSHTEFADESRISTSASYATTASHAEFSDNSRNSVSASYASTSSHSEFSDNSRNSVTASFATTASFSLTSSYAVSSSHEIIKEISSSFADTASFSNTASFAFSSSHSEFSDLARISTNATSASFATTASYALNAGSGTTNTGSLLVTASAVGTTITFTKGDSTTFDIVISQTGSIASASFATSASHAEFSDNTRDAISSSYAVTASYAVSSSHEIIQEISSSFATSASHAEFADESSTSISSSFATTASYALNAGSGAVTETLEYNGQIRYEIVSGSTKAQIVSTGNVYKNLSWSRSSTTLTVTSTGHGLSTGDNVLIRNMSEDYELKSITTSGVDAFTCTVADSGDTSGTTGAYIPAFDCSTISLTSGSCNSNCSWSRRFTIK